MGWLRALSHLGLYCRADPSGPGFSVSLPRPVPPPATVRAHTGSTLAIHVQPGCICPLRYHPPCPFLETSPASLPGESGKDRQILSAHKGRVGGWANPRSLSGAHRRPGPTQAEPRRPARSTPPSLPRALRWASLKFPEQRLQVPRGPSSAARPGVLLHRPQKHLWKASAERSCPPCDSSWSFSRRLFHWEMVSMPYVQS